MTAGPAAPRRRTARGATRSRRAAASLLLVALAASAATPTLRADDGLPARERFWKDGDAKALAAALGASTDPADREDAALARLAASPAAPLGGGADVPALARAVEALGRADLAAASDAMPVVPPETDVRRALVRALLEGRRGRDEDAIRRLLDSPAPVLARDGAALAILGAALADDDRDLLSGLLRAALVRAGSAGRADRVTSLAEAAAALDADAGALAVVPGARILRRTGRPADALALLDGAAAVRAGRTRVSLRLERAILAWRRNDAATARAEAQAADRSELPWVADALARSGLCCAVVPAPPTTISEGGEDADAVALARLLTTLGSAVRAEDVATRAAAKSTSAADPAFVRAYLDSFEVAHVEVAGDSALVDAALAKGLPVLVWRIRRDGERFVDRPLLLRGHDPTTGLLLVDEADPYRPDVMPSTWTRKSRVLLVAPHARASELAAFRDTPAARRGAFISAGLSALAGPTPGAAVAAFAARPPGLEGDPVVDLYAGFAGYAPAFAAHDAAGIAEAAAILRRSGGVAPATPLERLIRAEATLGGDPGPALDELGKAELEEGRAPWIEVTRFVILASARRHADALVALGRARELDPIDVRTLYFRAGTRRLLGDGPGSRADLVRVLERRPDHVPAAEDLAGAYVEDGDPDRALAVVKALVAADAAAGTTRRVRQLRQRVELRLVRRARSADDLTPLAASPEPDVRGEVAWTASSFETDAAEALLRSFLADPDESVRRRAALAYQRPSLGDRAARDPALVSALSARLAAEPSAGVREALVRALGRVSVPAVVPALAARLAGPSADPAVGVRAAIAEAFSTIEGPEVRRALVMGLSDADSAVRTASIRALLRLVGTAYGFEPDDPPERRAAAIAEWNRRLAGPR